MQQSVAARKSINKDAPEDCQLLESIGTDEKQEKLVDREEAPRDTQGLTVAVASSKLSRLCLINGQMCPEILLDEAGNKKNGFADEMDVKVKLHVHIVQW